MYPQPAVERGKGRKVKSKPRHSGGWEARRNRSKGKIRGNVSTKEIEKERARSFSLQSQGRSFENPTKGLKSTEWASWITIIRKPQRIKHGTTKEVMSTPHIDNESPLGPPSPKKDRMSQKVFQLLEEEQNPEVRKGAGSCTAFRTEVRRRFMAQESTGNRQRDRDIRGGLLK